jgi:nucleotide-binding universal stress UspA family protein
MLQADLAGIAIVAPLDLPPRLRGPGPKAVLTEEFDKSLATAEALAQAFAADARAAGAPRADAKVVQGDPLEALSAAAQAADLVVVSQPDADDVGLLGGHFVEEAITSTGRPVLVVPRKHDVQEVGRHILVAWKSGDGSARAVTDARPLLEKAGTITVLAVEEDGSPASTDEALAALQRLGASARSVVVKADDAGAAILAQAKKAGADLIVMGALRHHRLTEMILGGATRTVLEKAAVCVLMSHGGA